MSVVRRSPSFNSSAASSEFDNHEDGKTIQVKNFAKLLKSRIFLGRYVERRLVNERIGYRDIVLISAAEVDLKRDLLSVQHKLQTLFIEHWIGISYTNNLGFSPDGVCIWTEIDNQPFGPIWFQIKSFKFRDAEIMVAVKCLRHISDAYLEIEPFLTGAVKKTKATTVPKPDAITDVSENYTDILETLKSAFTVGNVIECFKFLFALIIAIVTGGTSFIHFLGNFVLGLIREMSILITNSTPMFLGLLDFFSKIIGGFYILLAMFFKQSTPVPSNKRSIGYYERSHRSSARYNDGQFD